MLFGQFRLLVRTDRADHVHAQRARPLAGDQADAAGGRVEQDGVAGLELAKVRRNRYCTVRPCSIMAAPVSKSMRPAA
jgi:hypothetical protein